jgi:protein arginine kinase activator
MRNLELTMKCQYCEQLATVIYTKIVGDKSQKIHLCAECADEQGITNLDHFNLPDLLMNDEHSSSVVTSSKTNASECPECGFTRDDLRKIGRLGCSTCYEIFGNELKSMIHGMHKGTEHKGKVPQGMLQVMEVKTKLKSLQSQLEQAIENEDYEKAGKLKKELATYQKSIPVDAGGVK